MQASSSFGQWLKQRRKALDLTQAELALRCGYSTIAIRKVEADTLRPSRQMAQMLADHLAIGLEQREAFLRFARADPRVAGIASPAIGPDRPGAPLDRLPLFLTSFVGREGERAEIERLLAETRLLTLTGTGGCGKTRLAVQVASDLAGAFADGIRFVDLAPLADPANVPLAFTAALALRETPGGSPLAPLVDYLRGRELLLVVDNCEHLLNACAELTEALIRACPRLRVLATSRERLGVDGETAWRVPSLSLPDPRRPATAAGVARSEAAQLFRERARAVRPSFEITDHNAPAVAQICGRLDGIPLAIELAAARARVLAVEQIAARLDDRFRLLTGGGRTASPRHQTLGAAIDWSYQLLSPAERTLLRRLAVFAGGWTLEAAEAICGDDVLDPLTSLVDKSMVVAESLDGEEARYRLLETIRQYANEKLLDGSRRRSTSTGGHDEPSSSEAVALRGRHRDWYLAFAERAREHFFGPEQLPWLDRLEREHDNLRSALAWCIEAAEPESAMRMVEALERFWNYRGHEREERAWLHSVMALPGGWASNPALRAARARLLAQAGSIARRQDELDLAASLLEESLAIRRGLDDAVLVVHGLYMLGTCRIQQGRYAGARVLLQEARDTARQAGLHADVAEATNLLGYVAFALGDLAAARAAFEEAASINRSARLRQQVARSIEWLGNTALAEGRPDEAQAHYEEALALYREAGDRLGGAHALQGLGLVAVERGDAAGAETLLRECLAFQREIVDRPFLPATLDGLAGVAALRVADVGTPAAERALRLAGAAAAGGGVLGRGRHWQTALAARWLAPAFSALGGRDDPVAGVAWVAGQAMTVEQAVAYALEVDDL